MTDEERKEAERLAHEQNCYEDGFDRRVFDCLVNMYGAACEANRTQISCLQDREAEASRAYLTERRRVRPLIRACQVYRNLVKGGASADHDAICFALAQYEELDRGEDESPNKYRPWEAMGISETKYFKKLFIKERIRSTTLVNVLQGESYKSTRETLAMMVEGEGDDPQTYRDMAEFALRRLDSALAEYEAGA